MAVNDPLADMLTRIRNGSVVKFESVSMPHSRLKKGVADILKREGYIKDYRESDFGARRVLTIDLKYDDTNQKIISNLKRISKPGRRVYVKHDEIPRVMSGLGISILSTSRGIISDTEARSLKVGGELLCEVW